MLKNQRKKIRKEAFRKLFKIKGKALLAFLLVILVYVLLFALRLILPILFAIDFFSVDEKISTSFFVFTALFLIVAYVFLTPINYGVKRWYLKEAKGISLKVSDIFYYFKDKRRFLKVLYLKLDVSVRIISQAVIIYLPSILMLFGIIYTFGFSSDEAIISRILLIFIFCVLVTLQTVFLFIFTRRYFLVDYLVTEGLSARECIKKSVRLMQNERKSILSFYFFLLPFAVVLPIIYLYSQMTFAVYANCLISKGEKQ